MSKQTHYLVRISQVAFSQENPLEIISATGEKLEDLGENYTENQVWLAYQKHNRQDEQDIYLICRFEGEKCLDVSQVLFDFGEEEGDPFLDKADPVRRSFARAAFGG